MRSCETRGTCDERPLPLPPPPSPPTRVAGSGQQVASPAREVNRHFRQPGERCGRLESGLLTTILLRGCISCSPQSEGRKYFDYMLHVCGFCKGWRFLLHRCTLWGVSKGLCPGRDSRGFISRQRGRWLSHQTAHIHLEIGSESIREMAVDSQVEASCASL